MKYRLINLFFTIMGISIWLFIFGARSVKATLL